MVIMDKFIVRGGRALNGEISISGAKNVALKVMIASLLTDEELILHNIPQLRDVRFMLEVLKFLGVSSKQVGSTVILKNAHRQMSQIPLDVASSLRTSSMVLGPLLARYHTAVVPNPGGCRLGARPIDRHIDGLIGMGAQISYNSEDGYFYGNSDGLHGVDFTFVKNTHTGTETLLLAAVLARGTTILRNAAEEIEIDDLILLLNKMGGKICRKNNRVIEIEGVPKLHGAEFTVMSDRNEEVTFAIASALTNGSVIVKKSNRESLEPFLSTFKKCGGGAEEIDGTTTRYYKESALIATDVITLPHPGFMTDWQAPWAAFLTQASGVSTIHETIFESRFSYVHQLRKMGAQIDFYQPLVENPEAFYNFNWQDHQGKEQAIRIVGPTKLHNAVLHIDDLRAGATLVLAALAAEGESVITGIEQIDRGYEHIEVRLSKLGADIIRKGEELL